MGNGLRDVKPISDEAPPRNYNTRGGQGYLDQMRELMEAEPPHEAGGGYSDAENRDLEKRREQMRRDLDNSPRQR